MQLSAKSGLSLWISPCFVLFPLLALSYCVFKSWLISSPFLTVSFVTSKAWIWHWTSVWPGGHSVGKKITLNRNVLVCVLKYLFHEMVFPQQTCLLPRERNGLVEASLCAWIKTELAVGENIRVLKWILQHGFILSYITNILHKYKIEQPNFISFWWNK